MWLITFECDLLEHDFRLSEVRRTGVLVVAIDCCPHVYIVLHITSTITVASITIFFIFTITPAFFL